MTLASPIQNNTNAGEISPLLEGRVDLRPYLNGLKKCINFVPIAQGPVTRRPGTMYVAEPKFAAKQARLVRFEYSTTQAYIIEFGDQYVRFYRNEGRLESPPGTPVEVATPYLEADLFNLSFTQSADVLYITHPSYAPRKLVRLTATTWSLNTIVFLDGPYLRQNSTATTITPSATTGSVTLTASAATFTLVTDVGRVVRIQHASTWGYARITAVASTTSATADVVNAFGATTASTAWRLGVWSATTGYPAVSTFYGDRFYLAGATLYPDRIDGSVVSDYENFAPSSTAGVVADDNAVSFTLNSNTVNAVYWMADDEKGLLVGTSGGEWVVRPSTINEALTPTNISAKRGTKYGSKKVMPALTGKAVLFVQRAGRKLREMAYSFEDDGFKAPDVSILSEHITVTGIKEMSYQAEPQSIIWSARTDGTLLSLTYEASQQVYGWARHRLGGDPAITDIFAATYSSVESTATIPSSAGTSDETWFLVKRTLNGAVVRTIEYLTPFYVDSEEVGERFFVDGGLIYDGAPATVISGIPTIYNGVSVQILADGATHPNKTVTAGAITLDREASVVHIGLGYISDVWTQRINAGATTGTSQGKVKRIHKVVVRLFQTLGLKFGPRESKLDVLPFRRTSDPMDQPPPYLDDDTRDILWNEGYTTAGRMYFRQDQPLPMTILAVMPEVVTQD
jgi:hypothetical protein